MIGSLSEILGHLSIDLSSVAINISVQAHEVMGNEVLKRLNLKELSF